MARLGRWQPIQARVLQQRSNTVPSSGTASLDLSATGSGSTSGVATASLALSGAGAGLRTHDFEGGSDGAALSTSESGAPYPPTSITTSGSGTATYATASAFTGSLGGLFVGGSGSAARARYALTSTQSASFAVTFRINTSLPAGQVNMFIFQNSTTTGALVAVNSSGQLLLVTGGGVISSTYTNALVVGTWYRLEVSVLRGTSTSDGTMNTTLKNALTGAVIESLNNSAMNTGFNTLSSYNGVEVGKFSTTQTISLSVDDVVVIDTASLLSYISAAPTGTASLSLSGVGSGQASGVATASLSLSATGDAGGGSTASGTASLSLSGDGSGRASGVATASLSLSGTGVTSSSATATADLLFSGTGTHSSVGSASLSVSGTGAASTAGTGVGSLSLSAANGEVGVGRTGTASLSMSSAGAAQAASTGVASVSLSGAGVAQVVAVATASLSLSAANSAVGVARTGTASLSLSAVPIRGGAAGNAYLVDAFNPHPFTAGTNATVSQGLNGALVEPLDTGEASYEVSTTSHYALAPGNYDMVVGATAQGVGGMSVTEVVWEVLSHVTGISLGQANLDPNGSGVGSVFFTIPVGQVGFKLHVTVLGNDSVELTSLEVYSIKEAFIAQGSGSASLALSGIGAARSPGVATALLTLSGTATPTASTTATAALTLGGAGSAGVGAPTGLSVTPVGADTLLLDWDDYPTAVLFYEIERDGLVVATSGVSTYTDTPLTSATNYCYRVRAVL